MEPRSFKARPGSALLSWATDVIDTAAGAIRTLVLAVTLCPRSVTVASHVYSTPKASSEAFTVHVASVLLLVRAT
jgi:hypothetical protein